MSIEKIKINTIITGNDINDLKKSMKLNFQKTTKTLKRLTTLGIAFVNS